MTKKTLAFLSVIAAFMLPAVAQAHWCGCRDDAVPNYRYIMPPYDTVEVAPNIFYTADPYPRDYPYVGCLSGCSYRLPYYAPDAYVPRYYAPYRYAPRFYGSRYYRPRVYPEAFYHRYRHRAVIRHWHRHRVERTIIHTRRVMHEAPVMVPTRHVADVPPPTVERHPYRSKLRRHIRQSRTRWYE